MKRIFLLAAIVAFIAIACESLVTFQLYQRDITDLINGNLSELFVNATIEVEGSDDDFNDAKELLLAEFRNPKNFRLEAGDYSDNIVADYDIPVVLAKDFEQDQIDLFTIIINPIDKNSYDIGLAFNKGKYYQLNAYVEEIFWGSLDLEEFKLVFDFQNDANEPIDITWQSVYINGKAVPISNTTTLNKRDTQEILLSEVFINSLLDEEESIIYFGKIEM